MEWLGTVRPAVLLSGENCIQRCGLYKLGNVGVKGFFQKLTLVSSSLDSSTIKHQIKPHFLFPVVIIWLALSWFPGVLLSHDLVPIDKNCLTVKMPKNNYRTYSQNKYCLFLLTGNTKMSLSNEEPTKSKETDTMNFTFKHH